MEEQDEGLRRNMYSITTESQLRQGQEDDVDRVSATLSESRATAIVLLRHFNWNVTKLFDRWFDDEVGVRAKLGLFAAPIVASPPSYRPVTCGICFETPATVSASCGHLYCRACWGRYIAKSISDDGSGCLTLTCPDPSCPASVGEDMVEALAATHSDKEKFSRCLLRSYVEESYRRRKIRWCPAPDCNYAIDFTSSDFGRGSGGNGSKSVVVRCWCSHSFCWNCGEEVHRPASCGAAVEWAAKNVDEGETAKWILVNTKACPQCERPIEKDQGCNHIRCPAPCRHEFCWHCLGAWSTQNYHSCYELEQSSSRAGVEAVEIVRMIEVRASLSKYTQHYEHWARHLWSRQKAANDLKALQEERLVKHYGQKKACLGFIVQAWREIIRCKSVLQWSCVYGYYFPEDQREKRQFFEYLQEEAEFSLERLHECAEQGMEKYLAAEGSIDDFMEYCRKLSELTFVIRSYFDSLVNTLEDGLLDVTGTAVCDSSSSSTTTAGI